MNNVIATNPIRIARTTFQDLPADVRARVESKAVDAAEPYVAKTQPALPVRVAPDVPGEQAPISPLRTESIDASLIVDAKAQNTTFASKLGAKIAIVRAVTNIFLNKVVRYIVAAARYVATCFVSSKNRVQEKVAVLFAKSSMPLVDDKTEVVIADTEKAAAAVKD